MKSLPPVVGLTLLLVVFIGFRATFLLTSDDMGIDSREHLIVQEVERVRAGMEPTLFHWPGTPWTYLLAWSSQALNVTSPPEIVRFGRVWVLVFGCIVLWATAILGMQFLSASGGLTAALVVACSPVFFSQESYLALVDTPALAFGLVGLLVALQATTQAIRRYRLLVILGAGILVGLGIAFKAPVLVFIIPIGVLLRDADRNLWKTELEAFGLLLAGIAFGFAVGCPFLVQDVLSLRFQSPMFDGLRYESAHYRSGHFGILGTAHDAFYSLWVRHFRALGWAMSFGLAGVSVVGATAFVVSARRASKTDRALALWWLITVVLIAANRFSFPRHWVVALPPFALATVATVERLRPGWVWVGRSLLVAAILAALGTSLAFDTLYRRPSTIAECDAWLADSIAESKAPGGVSIGPTAPVLSWLYPSTLLEGHFADIGQADIFVVAVPEAQLQLGVLAQPQAYRDTDFFPLERGDFETGTFYRELFASSNYIEIKRFASKPPGWASLLGVQRLPFPLNALLHPELIVYSRRNNP